MSYSQVRASLQEKARSTSGVKDVADFQDEHPAAPSLSKMTMGSTQYNIYNKQFAGERRRPNVFSKSTSGTVFGGAIGAQES